VDAPNDQMLDQAYWEEQCVKIPSDAPYIKMVMGMVVDYFKPVQGKTYCDMLTAVATASESKHQWSADGATWRTPLYGRYNFIRGGSATYYPRDYIDGDKRMYLSFWGMNSQALPASNHGMFKGVCCSYSYSTSFTHFGKSFTMYYGSSTFTLPPIGDKVPHYQAEHCEDLRSDGARFQECRNLIHEVLQICYPECAHKTTKPEWEKCMDDCAETRLTTLLPTPAPTAAPRVLPCYVETFQKTGCRRTVMWQNNWWDSQPDVVVGSDMYAYCSLVSAGQASAWQQSFCCDGAEGEAKDKACGAGMTCTKQSQLSCPNPPSEERKQDNYLFGCMAGAFLATGCKREVIAAGPENWWVARLETGQNYTVFKDMYNYCVAQRNGPTAEQQDTCCNGNEGTQSARGCGSPCQQVYGNWEKYCPQPHKNNVASLKASFQATGCPNGYELEGVFGKTWGYLENQYAPLWGYMTEEQVLDNMYDTCHALATKRSTNQQRSWCCGPDDWEGKCGETITCTKQTKLITTAARRMLESKASVTEAVYV